LVPADQQSLLVRQLTLSRIVSEPPGARLVDQDRPFQRAKIADSREVPPFTSPVAQQ
jgi:hypothetical protein